MTNGLVEVGQFLGCRNLTLLDFCLWNYIKSNVYKMKVEGIRELKDRIEKEIKVIDKRNITKCF